MKRFSDAINEDNPGVYTTYWTDGAEMSNPDTGETLEGKDAISEFLQKRAKEIKERGLKFSFNLTKTEFPDPDSAIVEGVVEVTDNGAVMDRVARRVELEKDQGCSSDNLLSFDSLLPNRRRKMRWNFKKGG